MVGVFSTIKNPVKHEIPMMRSLPRIMKMDPIEPTTENRPAFFKINKKAVHAPGQKDLFLSTTFVISTYLNICVFSDELNTSIETVNQVPSATNNKFSQRVL
jgi:hypothetical protein